MTGIEIIAAERQRQIERLQCDHDWEVVHDWEGDPGVIGGTQDICYLRCRVCGTEDYDIDPIDYAPDCEADDRWDR